MALSLSSSSSSSRTCLYDVFPSFSGEDVRVTFLSHLLKEFDKKLIIAFKDNEIQRSRSLDPELKQAIKDSRIAVVIFSKKYASSSWCLNELLEIVKCREECGQKVIPVFYGLDPSHVRKQTGEFGKIFEETCMSQTEEETIQWRRALTDVASTLGYHSAKWGNKANMIEEIVKDVMDKLLLTPSKDSENFVGIEDHISEMSILLQLESEEVRMVGLWGSSGIGKTTIARVLFQRLSRHFQSSIFIDRAFISKSMEIFNGAHPDDYNIKLHLQRNFLSEILGKGDIKINHLSAVAERLKHQKVQICIDDLDDQTVLDALVGQTQWFGSGSRIILVTDNKHFLRAHGIGHIYQVCLPSEKIAVEMLCRSAFRKNAAPEGFEELVVKVARLAGRLPLALSVLGSSLRGRDMKYWMDLLPRLQNGIHWNIEKKLRVSYDGLRSEEDKAIFRHIACLFNGVEVAYLKLLLADSGLSVNIVLKNLADKSLIHIREDHVVEMPRLLQEMGRRVVRLEEPEKREFLVDSQDICDVLSEGTGTQKVIGISLDIDEIDELYLHENAFRGMRNLRFVQIHTKRRLEREVKLHLPENFDYLPPKLKLLRWDDYPMRCMPSKFCPENLVELKMENSKLETLWKGIVTLPCLKEVDLSGSQNLIEVPDLSKATNLKTLNLTDCYSLVKLPSSIPHPNKLTTVKMSGCRNLETIPIGISLKSLKYLDLKGCSRLRTFPQISTNIEKLFVSETAIEEFPSDSKLRFENLCSFSMTKLRSKNLWKKVKPVTFLTAIMHPSLRQLRLSDISTLVELPSSFQNLHQLQELVIMNCVNLETLPTETNLMSLEYLNLSGCSRLRAFPDISTNIKKLVLSKTAIEEVPWWIEKFYSLQVLKMNGCNKLKSVSLNISKLKHLWEDGFDLIRGVSPFRRMDIHVDLTNCLNLDQEALFRQNTYFGCQLYLSGEEVPSYFTHRTTGTYLTNIPLPHTFPFQPFFKFKACALVYAESISKYYLPFKIQVRCQFIDRLGNHDYSSPLNITETKLGSHMVLFDCCFPLKKGNVSVAGLNYDHVNIQFHLMSNYSHHLKLKECGIRLPKDSPNFIEQVSEGYRSHKVIFGGHEAVKISSLYNWSYDVFLRFRGEGVRVNLLSYFLRNLDRKQMNVIKDKDMGRGQSLVPSRKKVGEAYEKTCKNRTTKEKTQLRGPLTNAASIPGYQYVTLGDEAKMTEEIGNEVLSKLNLTPSVEQTEMTHNHDAGGSIPEALTDVDGETDGVLWNAKSTVNAKEAESVQGEAKFNERSRKDDSFLGEINSDATFNAQNIIEKKTVEPFKEENKHGKVSESSTMVTNYKHIQEHQVFINFWGEEVRFSFISHLVSALSTEGVNVFIERYEKRGEDGKTLPGIEDSKIALVVFTSRYTESRWCLDELVKIKERMDEGKLLIIPIFYEMEPSQVQQLEGNFGLKLWNLWRIHRDNHIIKWKEALESVAAMKGLCSKEHSSESNFITFIVKKVKEVIRISLLEGENQSFLLSTEKGKTTKMSRLEREKHKSFHDKSPLFGIEKNMRQLEKKLEFDCSETRIIGVVGIAGIGKTTLLTILHEKWTCKFVRSVPLLGIHKKSEHYGLAWLRQTLLVVLLGGKFGVINDKTTHDSLKDKLLQTKVFVVLDDVSNKKQLKFLLGDLTWIKKGSVDLCIQRVCLLESQRLSIYTTT